MNLRDTPTLTTDGIKKIIWWIMINTNHNQTIDAIDMEVSIFVTTQSSSRYGWDDDDEWLAEQLHGDDWGSPMTWETPKICLFCGHMEALTLLKEDGRLVQFIETRSSESPMSFNGRKLIKELIGTHWCGFFVWDSGKILWSAILVASKCFQMVPMSFTQFQ